MTTDPHPGDFTVTPRILLLASIAVGVGAAAAVAALALLRLMALFNNLFFFGRVSVDPASPADHALGPWAIFVPVAGAVIVGLMARFWSERIRGHGIPEAIEAILLRGSRIEPRVAIVKPLSAAISIGSGGPFGAEGPIIVTGGAIGSILAQMLHLTASERKTLLVAGSAAGMSAVFASPVAAVLLAGEVLLFEWKPRSLLPVALASATAAALRPLLLGPGPVFPVPAHAGTLTGPAFAAALVCGVIAGLAGTGLTRALYAVEDGFKRLPVHWMWWPALGGLVVGVGGWMEPHALGVGYENIGGLLTGTLVGQALVTLLVAKTVIWIVSLGSGTSGGVLAPLLTIGAGLGGLEALVFPDLGVGAWPLVGMGATFAATLRAPLTALVFAFELTYDTGTMLPMLLAITSGCIVSTLALPRSILTEKIARRGVHVSCETATDPLEIVFVREVMAQAATLQGDLTAAEARSASPDQRLHTVVAGGQLVGVVTRRDLEAANPGAQVGTLARSAVTARVDEILRVVVNRMAETGRTRLPVVDPEGRVVGLVALDHLLQARVRNLVEEHRRERTLFPGARGPNAMPDPG